MPVMAKKKDEEPQGAEKKGQEDRKRKAETSPPTRMRMKAGKTKGSSQAGKGFKWGNNG